MLLIDGSYGEGGGQIIRTALSLSAITKKAFQVKQIRPARDKPGLQPQHLMACLAVKGICRGDLKNAELNQTEFTFHPREIQGGEYEFDIGTAGSALLVAQTLIPILLFASTKSSIRIIGGTYLPKSPGFDYFDRIFLPAIAKFGAKVDARLIRPGYYPRGGGIIEFSVEPSLLQGNVSWKQKDLSHAVIRLSRLPEHIAEREKTVLLDHQIADISIYMESSFSPGNSITVWQGFKGAEILGRRGIKAEEVALEAVQLFRKETEEVDVHLADQLLLYASLAKGKTQYSTSSISAHLQTNAYVIAQFLNRRIDFIDHSVFVE